MKMPNILAKSTRANYFICKCVECGEQYEVYLDKRSSISVLYCAKCKTLPDTEPTQEMLKKFFNYNPTTGEFTRRLLTGTNSTIGEVATHKNAGGYLVISWSSKTYLAHRLAWLYMYGKNPQGQLDHIDHDRANNAILNLREVQSRENQLNCSLYRNNTTGINGVSIHKKTGKYRAYIMVNRRQIHLGLFSTLEEAKQARREADNEYGFHNNHGR